jgi:hypothetical protein
MSIPYKNIEEYQEKNIESAGYVGPNLNRKAYISPVLQPHNKNPIDTISLQLVAVQVGRVAGHSMFDEGACSRVMRLLL